MSLLEAARRWCRPLALTVLAALAVSAPGCAVNPVTGRREVTLVSTAGEKEIGEEAARDVEESMGIVADSPIAEYVAAIGRRLAQYSPRHDVGYVVRIVDTPEPNAFALPGGFVYVSRGLLALANSEDELANAIGHEIGHVAARHAVQRVSRAAPIGILTGVPAALTGIIFPRVGDAIAGVGGVANDLILAPFDRDQEREADRVGQDLAARGGWDPMGLASLLRTLEREEALRNGGVKRTSFLSSHPSTPERVATTEAAARGLTRAAAPPIAAGRAAFLSRLDGLAVGESAARGVVRSQKFLHRELDFTVTFPAGWPLENAPRSVSAAPPDGAAIAVVQIAGNGDDPGTFAREFEQKTRTPFKEPSRRVVVSGLPAVRALTELRTSDGAFAVDLAWIAHHGRVYRIAGMTRPPRLDAYRARFGAIVESFRALTHAERESLTQTRLRIVHAREGESLAQLVARVPGAAWTAAETAVANGRQAEDHLRSGDQLKLAVKY
jgi:predicted Zn-dependent protease